MTPTAKTLYIMDGSAYIFRAFHATPAMTTQAGFPTGALFGFTNMLRRLVAEYVPDYLAVAFDAARVTFRTEMYPEYKANRSAPPDELLQQIPRIRDLVDAFRIPAMIQEGVEADDLIASMVKKARAQGIPVVIVTSDKDLMQLLGDGVTMLDPMKNRVLDVPDVIERFQVPPEKVVDVLALAGDASDNVPGVPGIGEKTAGKLIAEFGSLDAVLAQIDKVSGAKRQENLRTYKDLALLSRELVRLKDDVDVAFDLEALRLSNPDYAALGKLFQEFEFKLFLRDIQSKLKAEEAPAVSAELVRPPKDYRTILTEEELDAAIAACRAAGVYAFDLETTSLHALEAEIVGVSLSWADHQGVYIPVAHRGLGVPRQLPLALVLERLTPLWMDEGVGLLGHNIKYDWLVLRRYGVTLPRIAFDTMLASYLLDAGQTTHSLDALARAVLHQPTITFEEVAGKGKDQLTFDLVDVARATQYAAEDADVTRLLYKVLEPALKAAEGLDLLQTVELPLALLLGKMEERGILIHAPTLQELSSQFEKELQSLEAQAWASVGQEFNLNSPKQLQKVLFEDLALPVKKKTQTGPSTDQEVLEQLAGLHPLPALILEHRSFSKLKSTYLDALPSLADAQGRVHTNFNQTIAATGRLSSSGPNLQNIPVRTARGREIRRAFVPAPGQLLLSADYSQIELRILAHLSQDKALCESFNMGEDVHRRTASEIFNVPALFVTPAQRAAGKTINFGVIYGMGPNRLAQSLGITHSEAKKYIDAYFVRYKGVQEYFDALVQEARSQGFARTMFGRRRPIPELNETRPHLQALGERLAINTPIQGTAADLMKMAMLRVQRRLDAEGSPAQMLLQVHDELVLEAPSDYIPTLRALVSAEMVGVARLRVPLVVDTASGPTWLDAK